MNLGFEWRLHNIFKCVINEQALYSEIKGKKEKVDDVVKEADTCAVSIKVRLIYFLFDNYKYTQAVQKTHITVFTGLWAPAGILQCRTGYAAQYSHQEDYAAVSIHWTKAGGNHITSKI